LFRRVQEGAQGDDASACRVAGEEGCAQARQERGGEAVKTLREEVDALLDLREEAIVAAAEAEFAGMPDESARMTNTVFHCQARLLELLR
jgi:hypothetical protein